jgi:hypothetical protein
MITKETITKSYTLFHRSYRNDNTAEYGFGDYPETVVRPVLSLSAESVRDAQSQFKRVNPRIRFSGRFATYFVEEDKK